MQYAGAIIDGASIEGKFSIPIENPATGDVVGELMGAGPDTAALAVAAAKRAFAGWAATDAANRAACLMACAEIIETNAEDLAHLLTLEQGKPLGGLGSRFELGGAAAWTRHTASLTLPHDIIQEDAETHVSVTRKPLGVVVSITPWNWPLMIAIWHIMPALLAGNTVVIKPSPLTPLSTVRLIEMLQAALPPGVLNLVAGDDSLGPALTAHPDVAKIAFTGSCATGAKVMQSAAPSLKRLTLELGGNDAGIVLPDANPEEIAEGLFWGAFINNGQTCAALKRLFVHDTIYDAVCDALVRYAATVKVGSGLDEASVLGPIQNRKQLEIVDRLVQAAKADGAKVLTGGAQQDGSGNFYPITLVADARPGMALVDEEQFGPALPIIRYSSLDDAITSANSVSVGLGGSVWSADRLKARVIAQRLESGSVWINRHGTLRPDTPFGGVKSSGFGVEFGEYGLAEFVSLQAIHD
jgi:acyl-CoA reductase-like NAD-dependent aldehyde dehydrogenase